MTQLSLVQPIVVLLALAIRQKRAVEDGLCPCISTGYKLEAVIILPVKAILYSSFQYPHLNDVRPCSSMVLVWGVLNSRQR